MYAAFLRRASHRILLKRHYLVLAAITRSNGKSQVQAQISAESILVVHVRTDIFLRIGFCVKVLDFRPFIHTILGCSQGG